MKTVLFIKSSEHEQIEFKLFLHNKFFSISKFVRIGTMADKFLLILDKFLIKNKVKMSELDAIVVYAGPGSYTSLRIGLSVANAIAFSLNIPIFAIVKNQTFKEQLPRILKNIKINTFMSPAKAYYQQAIK